MIIDTPLTSFARRGTLTFMKPNFEFGTVEGWFYAHGNVVVRRKIRGRNESVFCTLNAVHDFKEYKKGAGK